MNDKRFTSSDGRFQVLLSGEVVDRILKFCKQAVTNETGGILVGYYTEAHDRAVVTSISGPPRDSRASRYSFHRGTWGLGQWLARLWRGHRHFYLGEWHLHPDADPTPSSIDREQMREIAVTPKYQCPEPILVIVGGIPQNQFSLSVQVFQRDEKLILLQEIRISIQE